MIPGLVSIAIPAYKRTWLKEAIESALSQDYDDIELIIVDDHSPQNLKEVVNPYLSDKRVSYYCNESNIGKDSVANNWNRCLEYIRGEFFILLCDDDILMPGFVSTLLDLARKYPQCAVFHGRRMLYHENTFSTEVSAPWPEYESFDDFVKAKAEVGRKHTITEFLYRSASILEESFSVFPVGYFSDDATVLKIVKKGGIASSCKAVCKIRISEERISGAGKYAVEKARAAIQYYDWYKVAIAPQTPQSVINNAIDDWAYRLLRETTLCNQLKILAMVPRYVWPLRQKTVLLYNMVCEWTRFIRRNQG